MIAKPLALSGTFDLVTITGGLHYTDIYYGDTPELVSLNVLSGSSNIINVIEFQIGSSYNEGSLIIGSQAPSGIYQVFDLENREIIFTKEVSDNNVEDFS